LFNPLRRREFIALVGGIAAWPLAARAQQSAMPVIGFLNIGSPQKWVPYLAAFKRGLGQVGYVEGRNVAIEYRWADFQYERLPALAVDLAGRKVAVIAANGGSRSALAAKSATTTIPVVFTFGDGDPVKHGLVKTINQPGGNVTGVTMIAGVLEPKRLELLREVAPKATVIYMLVNPNNAGVVQDLPEVATAASRLGLGFQAVRAGTESEIDTAFATLVRENARALMVANDAFLQSRSEQITTLAAGHALPTIYPWREYVDVGGLMSYGTSIREAYRQSGVYVGQILKGVNPAELPVQQPIKVELVINLKTAKALDLEIPMALLMRVDEVIE
jgi:putative ABC transport system substrate-binding protein